MWGAAFRKGIPTISLFHSAKSEASDTVLNQLKAAGAGDKFQLDITEGPPTPQQLQTMAESIQTDGVNDLKKAMSVLIEDVKFPVDYNSLSSALSNGEVKLKRPILVSQFNLYRT